MDADYHRFRPPRRPRRPCWTTWRRGLGVAGGGRDRGSACSTRRWLVGMAGGGDPGRGPPAEPAARPVVDWGAMEFLDLGRKTADGSDLRVAADAAADGPPRRGGPGPGPAVLRAAVGRVADRLGGAEAGATPCWSWTARRAWAAAPAGRPPGTRRSTGPGGSSRGWRPGDSVGRPRRQGPGPAARRPAELRPRPARRRPGRRPAAAGFERPAGGAGRGVPHPRIGEEPGPRRHPPDRRPAAAWRPGEAGRWPLLRDIRGAIRGRPAGLVGRLPAGGRGGRARCSVASVSTLARGAHAGDAGRR